MGKLDCGTNPTGTTVDIIPVLVVCSAREKKNEVIGVETICERKVVTQMSDGIL